MNRKVSVPSFAKPASTVVGTHGPARKEIHDAARIGYAAASATGGPKQKGGALARLAEEGYGAKDFFPDQRHESEGREAEL